MRISSYQLERRIAVESVVQACRLCQQVQGHLDSNKVLGKKDGSPVTVADFGAQALISIHLSRYFPYDALVGEEEAVQLRRTENIDLKKEVIRQVQCIKDNLRPNQILDAIDRAASSSGREGRFWTVDPIDGTKGFLRGHQYAVALALLEQDEVVVAVLGCPNLPLNGLVPGHETGSIFVAVKGEGAVMRGIRDAGQKEINVSDVTDPARAVLCESFESSHVSHGDSARISKHLGIKQPHIRMDSQCKYGIVARGDATVYLRITPDDSYLEKIWDHAAGVLIVHEAGGKVTDLKGQHLDFSTGRTLTNNSGIIATNRRLHDKVVEAIEKVVYSR